MRINFGKHSGSQLSELPDSYLEWIVDKSFCYVNNRRLHKAAEQEIKDRSEMPEISEAEIGARRLHRNTMAVMAENVKLVDNFIKEMYYA